MVILIIFGPVGGGTGVGSMADGGTTGTVVLALAGTGETGVSSGVAVAFGSVAPAPSSPLPCHFASTSTTPASASPPASGVAIHIRRRPGALRAGGATKGPPGNDVFVSEPPSKMLGAGRT